MRTRFFTIWPYLLTFLTLCIGCFYQYLPTAEANTSANFVATFRLSPKNYHHHVRLQARASAPVLQSIVSPVNGVITDINTVFGAQVKSGDSFLQVESAEMKKQYIDTIIAFLKSKDKLESVEKKAEHSKVLYASDIISLDSYNDTRNNLYSAKVDFLQVEHQLKKLCRLTQVDWKFLETLSLKDSNVIHQMLEKDSNITIHIRKDGILLPVDTMQGAKPSIISQGVKIESGQILAVIGKPHYFEFRIDIDEQDIDHIQVGQHAMVKSLQGSKKSIPAKVISVQRNPQAQKKANEPFTYPIVVQAFCEKDCPFRVGSNAKIDIHTHTTKEAFILPFSSINRDRTYTYVMVKNAQGTFVKKRITVSQTTPEGVIVAKGLEKGDIIASHYTMS